MWVRDRVVVVVSSAGVRVNDRILVPQSFCRRAPEIVLDPRGDLNGGRPTSVIDIAGCVEIGPLPPGSHYVPPDKDFGLWRFGQPLVVRAAAELHDEMTSDIGRPWSIDLSRASWAKEMYFTGRLTQVRIADALGVTPRTVSKLMRGEILWYA